MTDLLMGGKRVEAEIVCCARCDEPPSIVEPSPPTLPAPAGSRETRHDCAQHLA
jgi:hypothetical protein